MARNFYEELCQMIRSEGEPINFTEDYLAKVCNIDELNERLRDNSREMEAISGLGHQIFGHEV